MSVIFVLLIATLGYSAVDNSLAEDDMQYIPKFLHDIKLLPKNPTYNDELEFIASVQQSVINFAPHGVGAIPFYKKRDPKELFIAKIGGCVERSRTTEKILRYSGFQTRHISVYTRTTGSAIKSLLHPPQPISRYFRGFYE